MIASGLRQLALAVAVLIVGNDMSAATDASAWDQDARAGARLIAGDGTKAGAGLLRAGVEIRLARGWKTYWRYPGDSGVPPRFDFSGSSNVTSVAVSWPAPHRFSDASGQSIGYKERVIFPLHIVPQDASRPVTLRLNLDYGVCEKLCIPMQSKVELTLTNATSTHERALVAAEAKVPTPAALGDSKALAIRAIVRKPAPKPRVLVDLTAPNDASVDLFVEGPTADWALPLPTPIGGAPAGMRRFTFDLDGLPPGAKADGAVLTLTAVDGSSAIEVKARLD